MNKKKWKIKIVTSSSIKDIVITKGLFLTLIRYLTQENPYIRFIYIKCCLNLINGYKNTKVVQ
jgi:hypothetical protein